MSWADILPWVIEGARVFNDANTAEDKAKVDQERQTAQVEANRAQAVLAENNAKLADWQAVDAIYRSGRAIENVNTRTRLLKGRQIVDSAASGADISSGSVVNMLTDTDLLGAEEGNTIQMTAEREAWAYRMQALDSRNRATILRNAKVPVGMDTGTAVTASLLNSASRLYERSERN